MARVHPSLAWSALLLLMAVGLSGCLDDGANSARVGRPSSPDEGFELIVSVVSGSDGVTPIRGANVTVVQAQGDTGPDGTVTFTVDYGTRSVVLIETPGHVLTQSVPIDFGVDDPVEALGEALTCIVSFAAFCFDNPNVMLSGARAELKFYALPENATVAYGFPVAAGTGADPGVTEPTGEPLAHWRAAELELAEDEGLHMARITQLAGFDATITWTNGLEGLSRLGVALGCNDQEAVVEEEAPMTLPGPGEHSVTATWDGPPTAPGPDFYGWASIWEEDCTSLYGGPLMEPGSTGTDATLTLELRFGPGAQWPVVVSGAAA